MTRIILSSLNAHRGRLVLTTLVIALSVSFVTASFVLADSLRTVFGEVSSEIYRDVDAGVSRSEGTFDRVASGERFDQSELSAVRAVDGIEQVVPGIGAEFTLFTVDENGETLLPQGPPVLAFSIDADPLDPAALSAAAPFSLIEGRAPVDGQIMLDTAQAAVLNVSVGDDVVVATPTGPEVFTLSGTVVFGEQESGVSPYFLLFNLATIQDLLDAPGQVDGAALLFDEGVDREAVIDQVHAVLSDTLFVTGQEQLIADQEGEFGELISVIQVALLGFAAITTLVSVFVIANTFAVLVSQQMRQLGLLRAIGATRRQAGFATVAEAALVGAIASAIGIGLGVLVAQAIKALFEAVTTGGFPDGPLEVLPRTIVIAVFVGIGVTVLSTAIPSWRAGRVTPIQALDDAAATVAVRRSVLGAMLSVLAGPVARLTGMSGRLASMNLQRNPRRVLSTAMSMIVGLALIAGMTVVGASYKSTLVDSMTSDFDADLIVTPVQGATVPFQALSAVADLEAADAASGFGATEVRFNGEVIDVASYQSEVANGVLDLGITQGTLTAFSQNKAAASVEFAEQNGLGVGDFVTIEFSDGTFVEVTLQAIFEDQSIVTSGLLVDESVVAAHARNADATLGAIRFNESMSAEQARTSVEATLAAYPQLEVQTVTDYLAARQALVDQILVLANALLVLTIIIAMTGIANTVALSMIERTRELGLLRSIGMSRRELRSMIRSEALMTSLTGAVIGTAVGVGVASLISAVLPSNVISQPVVPVGQVGVYLAVAVLLGTAAALLPAWRASRLNVVTAMRSDA